MSNYLQKISLKDQNIIVTGACGLLGKEITKAITEFGGQVIIADVDCHSGEVLAEELQQEFNIKSKVMFLDICSEESIEKFLQQIDLENTQINGLVNTAYPRNKSYGTKFENISYKSWQENINMHLNGYFNISQKVAQVMMRQKLGNIINMGSIYGFLGPDFRIYEGTEMTMPAEYSVIKGGLINFTKYLATYLADYNIRVNSISPGGIFNFQPEQFIKNYCNRTPLKRMGNPEDIAGGVIYLLSEMSCYVTGHNLVIDGGLSIW